MNYLNATKEELIKEKEKLQKQYNEIKSLNLSLDLSRGKPCKEQLDLSRDLITMPVEKDQSGVDCRNYGGLLGIDEMRSLWSSITGVDKEQIVVGGNSSLNMMFDTLTRCLLFGTKESKKPWSKEEKLKFLCPVPGYDRHFRVTETLGFELISVPTNENGPDMDVVEKLVQDESVKGIWCVPKYANPTGITYSDEVVTRLCKMETGAKDFVIMWDNAYLVHDFTENGDQLLNIFEEAKKYNHENRVFYFASTSKITLPGDGIAMMAMSKENLEFSKSILGTQTIGPDKINQLRHVAFLPSKEAVTRQMMKHAAIIRPKFEYLLKVFDEDLGDTGIAKWTKPNGGYFVSLEMLDGTAKKVFELCKEAGLTLTGPGACFPYGIDPKDYQLRIAPTYCTMESLKQAVVLLTCSVRLAALELLR